MNEFKIKNGYLSEGNSQITGSLNVSGGITGSLFGTASYATNAISASYAPPAFPYTGSALITGSLGITGSLSNGSGNIASGSYSHAEGAVTQAVGGYSHAEGSSTTSTGDYSHAEGESTTATGYASHAEGYGATAIGDYSHAEGESTTSTGYASHAEGGSTTAIGQSSHAEGNSTTAGQLGYSNGTSITSGVFELNSGYGNLASSFYPGVFVLINDGNGEINGTPNIFKLEVSSSTYTGTPATQITLVDTSINTSNKYIVGIYGNFTPPLADSPIGNFSHTSGEATHTVGRGSSTEGFYTEALGYYSHAEGSSTISSGVASHAEGESTTAIGDYSHAEGGSTIASGDYSHAEGRSTTATGYASHAEGYGTVASGSYQHVQGQFNLSSSAQSAFIIGNGTADNARSNLIFASGSQVQITGSVIATSGFTGSLLGTASYATNALSASYATNGGVTQIIAGPNITVSPTTGVGQVTISSTGGGGGTGNTATGSYGSFYDTTIQTNVASTARSMSLNTTDITNGVSISGSTNPFNTYIKVANAGVYDIQFSAQVDKTDSGTDEIWIWIRKNGTNISDSATSVQLQGNGAHYVAAWNFFVNAAANDYFQLMWYSPDANVRLHAEAGFGVVPGIPSLIVTANRVDQFLSNTGSFSGSFTGNLIGTASYATNALSASYAPPAFPYTGSATILGSLVVNQTATTQSLNTSTRTLFDSSSRSSVSWNSRQLNTPNSTLALTWLDDTILTSDVYQRDYKSSTIQDTVSNIYNDPDLSYLGDVIEVDDVSTFIDGTVTDGMLVYLNTNATWYPVDQAATVSTKLLGIAHKVSAGTGRILLEGHVVIDDTSTSGPNVQSPDHGLPIYIKNNTTTGLMSTVVPTTTGGPNIVRVLGHCYQQNSGTASQWMMKFRPSNDWVEI